MPFEELKLLKPIKNTRVKGKALNAQDLMTIGLHIERLEEVSGPDMHNW